MAKAAEKTEVTTRKPRAEIPANETGRDKFKRLANNRVSSALTDIRLIGQLGLSAEYEYTPEEAGKIVDLLKAAVNETAKKLTERKAEKVVANLFD